MRYRDAAAFRQALDLNREPRPVRESYGMTLFGQAALAARRLVEAGSRFVTVIWDEYGLAGSGWDTPFIATRSATKIGRSRVVNQVSSPAIPTICVGDNRLHSFA